MAGIGAIRPSFSPRARHARAQGAVCSRLSWRKLAVRRCVLAVAAVCRLSRGRDVLTADALTITRITVSGNSRLSKGEVVALLDGIRGTNMLTVDLESWRQKLLELAVGGGRGDSPRAARHGRGRDLRAAADGHRPHQRRAVPDRRSRRHHRRSSVPTTRSSTCRSSTASPRAPRDNGPLIDEARAALAARVLASLQTRPDLARRVSQIDVSDVRDAVADSQGRHGAGARRRRAVRRTAAVVPRSGAGAARTGRRTSTTSTCGSTSACTCRPQRRRAGA